MDQQEQEYLFARMLPLQKNIGRTCKAFLIQDPSSGAWRRFSQDDSEPWKKVHPDFGELLKVQTVSALRPRSPRVFLVCTADEKARYEQEEHQNWLSNERRNRPDLRETADWTKDRELSAIERHGGPAIPKQLPLTENEQLKSELNELKGQMASLLEWSRAGVSPGDARDEMRSSRPKAEPAKTTTVAPGRAEALGLGLEDGVGDMSTSDLGTAKSFPDDMTVIKGVGAKTDRMLKSIGIETYLQLASESADNLRANMESVSDMPGLTSGRVQSWIDGAAQILAQR